MSDAFLEYLELEGSGLDVQVFLSKFPDIAPKLEKKISAHRLFRQTFFSPRPDGVANN